jgi:hypothetical protein
LSSLRFWGLLPALDFPRFDLKPVGTLRSS